MIYEGFSSNYCRTTASRLRREARNMLDEARNLLEKAQEWEDAAFQRIVNK